MAFSDVIARLAVSLSLDTAAFQTGSRKARQEMTGMQRHINGAARAIGGALAGMVAIDTVQQFREMTRAAVDTVGALGEQAQQLGVTTDALQEFRFIASQTGIEEGEIDKALQRLTRTLGEIRDPTKAQAAALKELGLSAKDLEGLTADQALSVFADAFSKLPDAAARSATGFDLMGKSFQTLLPLLALGSKGIEQMINDAREAGIILTEAEIEAADRADDAIAAIDRKVAARLASMLARNGEMLVEFETMWGEAKIAVIGHVVALAKQFELLASGDWQQKLFAGIGLIEKLLTGGVLTAVREFSMKIPQFVATMVNTVNTWIVDKLGKVFDVAKAQIESVGKAFAWLYDVVVGHSYVPDMIDGIGAHMARLDGLMVKPAERATSATARQFEQLRDTLDELFPEVGKAGRFNAQMALIQGAGLSAGQEEEAVRRLWRQFSSGSPFGGGGIGGPDLGDGRLTDGMADVGEQIEGLTEKAEVGSVRIAKSFADMADSTLQSLSRLSSAIKGGGFFDILEAVIGVGLQLGQSGAFGKGVASFLNKAPSYAGGTSFHPGGLAMVGERGPELVSMPRGSKVYPHGTGPDAGGRVMEVRPSPLFEVYVDGKLVGAMPAAARGGVALMQYKQSRRVG